MRRLLGAILGLLLLAQPAFAFNTEQGGFSSALCGGLPSAFGCGDLPVLSLNFLAGNLPSQVSFSRSSTATYFNSSGVLSSASSGTPRFDYNPSTLALNGLLIEGQSTNLHLQSQYASGYTVPGVTLTASAATSPDGTSDAATVVPAATNAQHYFYFTNGLSALASTVYTYSVFAKANGYTNFELDGNNAGTNLATFQLSGAGSVLNTTGCTATITQLSNGWYRASITWTQGTAGNIDPVVYTTGNGTARTYTADGTSGYLFFGEQFEQQAFASSYIPTTSATVTRAADVGAQSYGVSGPVSFTISGITAPGTSGTQVLGQIDDGTSSNRIAIQRISTGHVQVLIVSGGTTQATLDLGSVANDTAINVGISAASGNFQASLNGGTLVTGSGSLPGAMTTIRYGSDSSGDQWFGWVRKFKLWNRALGSAIQQQAAQAA